MFLLTFGGAAAVGYGAGILGPRYHDEFSYVLQADTFASGRLANPPHPLSEHFESFHIIQNPTYASKYPPARGALLALGQVMLGDPAAGAWLGAAFMCAAILWMLQGWLPPRWAVIGGILTTLHFGVVGYWAQGYWGGSIAAGAGALVFGALRRLWARPRWSLAIILAVGVILLAASRPYEGFVVCIAASLPLGWRLVHGNSWAWVKQVVLPVVAVLLVGGYGLTSYNEAVTGSRWTLPYSVHMASYSVTPNFLFADPELRDVTYSDERLRRFYVGYEREMFDRQRNLPGYVDELIAKARMVGRTFAWGPPYLQVYFPWPSVVWIPLLFVAMAWRRRPWIWFAAGTITLLILAESVVTYGLGHYYAPVIGLLFVLIAHGLRAVTIGIGALRRRWHAWIGLFMVFMALSLGAGIMVHARLAEADELWTNKRRGIECRVREVPGDHLLLVAYDPEYDIHREWVYNGANIDAQRVIWARALDPDRDSALVRYYRDRTAWRVFVGVSDVILTQLGTR